MKLCKRFVSMLLAVWLALALLPTAAFAETANLSFNRTESVLLSANNTYQAYVDRERTESGYRVLSLSLKPDQFTKANDNSPKVYHGDLVTVYPDKDSIFSDPSSVFNGSKISWIQGGSGSGYIMSDYLKKVTPYLPAGGKTEDYFATVTTTCSVYSVPVGGKDFLTGSVSPGDRIKVYPDRAVVLSRLSGSSSGEAYAWITGPDGAYGYIRMSYLSSAGPEPESKPESAYRVICDANGGMITFPSSSERWAFEIKNGETYAKLPQVARAGYLFAGWYTAASGGTQVTTSTVANLTGDQTLYAHWESDFYAVYFDANGGTVATSGKSVEFNKPYGTLPAPTRSGYVFTGWYTAASGGTLVTESTVVSTAGSHTLYARWNTPAPMEDTFSFSNTLSYFNNNYAISSKYYNYLLRNETISWKSDVKKLYDRPWGGSCFGMSAVYCMSRGGTIDLSVFQGGASTLRALTAPKNSQNINDLINYYMIAQSTSGADTLKKEYLGMGRVARYQKIVSDLSREIGFSVMGFYFDPNYGHAIVARGISQGSDGNYHIEIWDPNYPDNLGELVISSDYNKAWFTAATSDSGRYNNNMTIDFIMPFSTRSQTYDASNLQAVFNRDISFSSNSSASSLYTFTSDTGYFTLTDSNGRSAVVRNGEQVSGDLLLLRTSLYCGADDKYRYYIQADNLDQLTVTIDGAGSEVRFVSDDILVQVSADGLDSMVVSKSGVHTSCKTSSQQEVTLVSEALGSTWNVATATCRDTSLDLSAAAGQLTVASGSSTPVVVRGENVNSGQTSQQKTVSPASGGTSVSMDSLTASAQSNPFADVLSGAYYYDAVLWAVEKGITNGTGDGKFSPNDPCTRAQIVTFLWRAMGSPMVPLTTNFTDVTPGSYYEMAVAWAVTNGITNGTGNGKFSPNDPCTRTQAVTFLHRAEGLPAASGSSFSDVTSGLWYTNAVSWAVANGITNGTGNGRFSPNDTCTRAQIVTFLYRDMAK